MSSEKDGKKAAVVAAVRFTAPGGWASTKAPALNASSWLVSVSMCRMPCRSLHPLAPVTTPVPSNDLFKVGVR